MKISNGKPIIYHYIIIIIHIWKHTYVKWWPHQNFSIHFIITKCTSINWHENLSNSSSELWAIGHKRCAITPPILTQCKNSNVSCDFRIIVSLILYCVYFFHVASSFKDYIECTTTTSAHIIFGVCYGSIVFKMPELFENIRVMEKVIEMSEQISGISCHPSLDNNLFIGSSKHQASKALFEKTCQEVEKWSEIIFFMMMRLSLPCIMLPVCIGSFFVYFTTNLGNESFILAIPMWWEIKRNFALESGLNFQNFLGSPLTRKIRWAIWLLSLLCIFLLDVHFL